MTFTLTQSTASVISWTTLMAQPLVLPSWSRSWVNSKYFAEASLRSVHLTPTILAGKFKSANFHDFTDFTCDVFGVFVINLKEQLVNFDVFCDTSTKTIPKTWNLTIFTITERNKQAKQKGLYTGGHDGPWLLCNTTDKISLSDVCHINVKIWLIDQTKFLIAKLMIFPLTCLMSFISCL